MPTRAFIFDVDGTLIDTNPWHASAWHRAMLYGGHLVAMDQVMLQIGKGGDQLVPGLLGPEVERVEGDRLRERHTDEFLEIAARTRFRTFPGVERLLEALRGRWRIRTAVATSSKEEHFRALCQQSELDLPELVDEVVTGDSADRTKPHPDLVEAALERLKVAPGEAMLVGDTPYDGEAARRAGVPFVAVLCGGRLKEDLEAAGAMLVVRDPEAVLENLSRLLKAG
jgi:HAD superfamily hydrolase (TIGR01509 family)